jgi:hypothetical protein
MCLPLCSCSFLSARYLNDDLSDVDDAEFHLQQAQSAELKRAFLQLARQTTPQVSEEDATLNATQFSTLLRSHLAAHAPSSAAQDSFSMEVELANMWSELPKTKSGGVTFQQLLKALSGGGSTEPTPNGSRRGSLTGAAPASSAVENANGAPAGRAAGVSMSVTDPLFKLFQRRPSVGRAQSIRNSGGKRHSESGRAGIVPSATSGAAAAANASENGGAGLRPRSSTLVPGSSASSFGRNGVPYPSSSSAASQSTSLHSSSPAPSGPTPSGALDLSDSDWLDLSWLVAAHPAAFSSVASSSPRTSISGESAAAPTPITQPTKTLVSNSALQIAFQHYLGRWLNQHELNVIGTMQKFLTPPSGVAKRPGGSGGPTDLLTFDVLQKTVASVYAFLRENPDTRVVDPLPSFAVALGLSESPLPTDDLLAHLNTFAVLPLEAAQSLLKAFGGGVLHSPPLLHLLTEHKHLTMRHTRLEKEYTLLTSTRESLDSSHADLSSQVPFLQERLEQAERERGELEKELEKSRELSSASSLHRSNYEKTQKKLQQVQEDSAQLRNEIQLGKEMLGEKEEELGALQGQVAKLKEKLSQTERELKELQSKASAASVSSSSSLAHLQEEHRTLESKHQDLLERSQIFYRRLVAVGETQGLEPIEGMEGGMLVGSLANNRSKTSRGPKASVVLRDELGANGGGAEKDSLGAELEDVHEYESSGKAEQQRLELEKIQQQLSALSQRVGDKDREIERLHHEMDALHKSKGATGLTPLEVGPSSDGEDATKDKGLCAQCAIM